MDLSALIFVALAVAWAVYLVPKALTHHDEAARSRSVEKFSHTMRVLAHREPTSRPEPAPLTPAELRARRLAARRATKRRRNVLGLLLVANLAVVGVAAFSLVEWWYVAIPAGLLVAWLVACRIMVKGERAALAVPASQRAAESAADSESDAMSAAVDGEADPMADTSAGMAPVDPALWDPVPVTLPTYVTKPPAARRTVRTIDLDDTGVWTSGRTDADAQIAREADEADRAARASRSGGDDQRAVGS